MKNQQLLEGKRKTHSTYQHPGQVLFINGNGNNKKQGSLNRLESYLLKKKSISGFLPSLHLSDSPRPLATMFLLMMTTLTNQTKMLDPGVTSSDVPKKPTETRKINSKCLNSSMLECQHSLR